MALIWVAERQPPALGEYSELDDHDDPQAAAGSIGAAVPTRARSRVGRDLLLVVAGLAAMAGGATVLVEAVRRLSGVEETQTKLGLTVVGFATAFELIVLAVAAARRGMTETVLASVVGSFAYNATMTLAPARSPARCGCWPPTSSTCPCWRCWAPCWPSCPGAAHRQAQPARRSAAAGCLSRLHRPGPCQLAGVAIDIAGCGCQDGPPARQCLRQEPIQPRRQHRP